MSSCTRHFEKNTSGMMLDGPRRPGRSRHSCFGRRTDAESTREATGDTAVATTGVAMTTAARCMAKDGVLASRARQESTREAGFRHSDLCSRRRGEKSKRCPKPSPEASPKGQLFPNVRLILLHLGTLLLRKGFCLRGSRGACLAQGPRRHRREHSSTPGANVMVFARTP